MFENLEEIEKKYLNYLVRVLHLITNGSDTSYKKASHKVCKDIGNESYINILKALSNEGYIKLDSINIGIQGYIETQMEEKLTPKGLKYAEKIFKK